MRPHPLAAYRQQNNITQRQLAVMLDISEGTVRRLEQGTLPLTSEYQPAIPRGVITAAHGWVDECRREFVQRYNLFPVEQDPNHHPFYNFRVWHELSINACAKGLCVSPRMLTDHEVSITHVIPEALEKIFARAYGEHETLAYKRAVERYQGLYGDDDD